MGVDKLGFWRGWRWCLDDLPEYSADRATDRIANRGDWTANAPAGVMDTSSFPTMARRRMVRGCRPDGGIVRPGAHAGLASARAENDCHQWQDDDQGAHVRSFRDLNRSRICKGITT
jgi:hypothetical protein